MTDSYTPAVVVMGAPELALIKATIAPDLTDGELRLFGEVCQRLGLDPFTRQIHATKRDGRMVVQTGIDGFRTLAERTGRYGGQLPDEWCGPDGQWTDVWLDDEPPRAARSTVVNTGHAQPTVAVALYREYVQRNRGGGANARWEQAPSAQLAKCAAALAFRKAFPQELSGVYTDDEMGHLEAPAPTVDVQATAVDKPGRGPSRYDQARYPQPQRAAQAPAEPVDAGTVGPAMGTAKQLGKVMAIFRDAGLGGTDHRDERLTITAGILHRELDGNALESTKVLTAAEMSRLIDALEHLRNTGPTLRDAYEAQAAQAVVDREGEQADARAAEDEAAAADTANPHDS